MGTVRIQTVCGFGCGSSLFLKMKIEEILKENKLDAEVFCGDVGTCIEPGRFWLDAARAVELTSSVCRVMEQIRREAGISFGKLPL